MVSANGRNTEQVEAAVNKASWVLGRIRKTFRYFDINLLLRGFEYPDRLRRLGYTDLETRRKRGSVLPQFLPFLLSYFNFSTNIQFKRIDKVGLF